MRNFPQIRVIVLAFLSAGFVAFAPVRLSAETTQDSVAIAKLQKQVEELADREAIRQLPIKYVNYIRVRNYDGLANLFAKDGGFHYKNAEGKDDGATGRDAIRAFYERTVPQSDPWAFVHNHLVELLGNGKAKGTVYSELRRGNQKMRLLGIGVYDDSYVKEGGVWKFQDRKMAVTPIPPQ